MITTRSYKNQFWIDLNSPIKEEIDSLILSRNINPAIAKDLLTPTPTQHIQSFDNFVYTVLHFPYLKRNGKFKEDQEIDFVISANELITARYDSIEALHFFAKQIEVGEILNKNEDSHIFFAMIKEIYNSITDELAYMEDRMREIEKNIFEGKEREMVFAISNAGRDLLNFRRTLDPHGKIFELLRDIGLEKFDEKFKKEAEATLDEWRRIMRVVNNQIDLAVELRETNNSMLSTKQNEVMKTFTILAFVTFPLSMLASIFGMNATHMPIIGNNHDFWIILCIMLTISLSMFTYFRYKKWI